MRRGVQGAQPQCSSQGPGQTRAEVCGEGPPVGLPRGPNSKGGLNDATAPQCPRGCPVHR